MAGENVAPPAPTIVDSKKEEVVSDEAPAEVELQQARRRRLELSPPASQDEGTSKRARGEDESSSSPNPAIEIPATFRATPVDERPAPAATLTSLSHGAASVIGRRRYMEDTVMLAPGFVAVSEGEAAMTTSYDFFGVYDGHGGARVALACRNRVHVVLAEEVARVAGLEEAAMWRRALATSFARVDEEICEVARRPRAGSEVTMVGSTAVVAVVGPRTITVANCGDSRAVLSRGGAAVPLSTDHKPDRPDEMARVVAAGGRVIESRGHRIMGVLATSRSIGDFYLKPYVSAEPEITVVNRNNESDEFLILASEGLWDVMTNELACQITRRYLVGRDPDTVGRHTTTGAAAFLADVATGRGSMDNISVIIVQLRRLTRLQELSAPEAGTNSIPNVDPSRSSPL